MEFISLTRYSEIYKDLDAIVSPLHILNLKKAADKIHQAIQNAVAANKEARELVTSGDRYNNSVDTAVSTPVISRIFDWSVASYSVISYHAGRALFSTCWSLTVSTENSIKCRFFVLKMPIFIDSRKFGAFLVKLLKLATDHEKSIASLDFQVNISSFTGQRKAVIVFFK